MDTVSRKEKPMQTSGKKKALLKYALITIALIFFGVIIFLPMIMVITQAFSSGINVYLQAINTPDARSAIQLTLLTTVIVLVINTVFGVCASWSIANFDFVGRNIMTTLIDTPLTVSPVISGLCFVLLFGAHGLLGSWMAAHNIKIIFAVPGIILVTLFITTPYISRALIPVMQAQGTEEEEAAIMLGARGWNMFRRVTLPKIKWGLLYGVILCTARAMGEFGAVSIVSGHIRRLTNTMPLHIEILYNEYNITAAFAVASLLTFLALITLLLKSLIESKFLTQLLDDDIN